MAIENNYSYYGGFLKWGYPQIINFRLGFSMTVRVTHLWKPPYVIDDVSIGIGHFAAHRSLEYVDTDPFFIPAFLGTKG
jgi:hypothetical protein